MWFKKRAICNHYHASANKAHLRVSRDAIVVMTTVMLSAFIAEAIVMLLLDIMPPLSGLAEALVDASLLAVLLFPPLYLFLFRPLLTHIAKQKYLEEKTQQSSDIQIILSRLLSLGLQDIPFDEKLEKAIDEIISVEWLAFDKGAIFLVEDEPDVIVLKAQRGLRESLQKICARVDFGRCICGRAAASGTMQFVDHLDQQHENRYDGITQHGHYCIPILSAGKVLGVICLYVKEGHRESKVEGEFLNGAASAMANIIEHYNIEKQLQQRDRALLDINRQLEAKVSQLRRSNQELQTFAYVASHDLREPLRKISAFGEILAASLKNKLNEDEEENLSFMVDGANRMQQMIEALLTYSRVTTKSLNAERVDPNAVVEELKMLELAFGIEETGAKVLIPEPLHPVMADPAQLRQLLQNLIANALKYQKEDAIPEVIISSRVVDNAKVRVEVQDNGIGIKEDHFDNIFTVFKRLHAKSEYEGTGVGLALCKKIVELHGGEMGVSSTHGQGSTFWFTMPALETPATEAGITASLTA